MNTKKQNYFLTISINLAILFLLSGGLLNVAAQQSGDENAALKQAFSQIRQTENSTDGEQSRLHQNTKLTASDGTFDDNFGSSVAVFGDTAIVGAHRDDVGANADQGSAYVFTRSGASWALQQKLTASDGAAGDVFGWSVAVANTAAPAQTVIMVGAYGDDTGANANQGSVYIFVRASGGTTWSQQGKLTATDGAANDVFGNSVAMTGSFLVVGANGDDIGANTDQGSAYIFVRNGTVWEEEQKLTAQFGLGSENMGWSVGISGTSAIIGTNQQIASAQGSTYIFSRVSGGNTWVPQLNAAGGGQKFGTSVAISGDTAVIGDFQDDVGANVNQGKAYIYIRSTSGNSWDFASSVTASDGAAGDEFGKAVGIANDTIVVGAHLDIIGGSNFQGSAYVFARSLGTNVWVQRQKILDSTGEIGDRFGNAVAVSGTTVFIGASQDDVGALGQAGSVSVFNLTTPFDFDGDGKADVSVFRPSNTTWYLQRSGDGFVGTGFGLAGDKLTPADYDADGKADLAVFRNGIWYLQRSTLGFTGIQFGSASDTPIPADFDADGKADLAVFRPSNGIWYVQASQIGFISLQFGANGDVPVPNDYDADGKADFAVFRPSTGTWYLQRSALGFTNVQFGQSGDRAVPADYDGDGRTDVAIYRAGVWYLLRSSLGITGISFGTATDVPTPADYDADGKADLAVFRPSNGIWYLQRSQSGFVGIQFGTSGDLPIPAAYIP